MNIRITCTRLMTSREPIAKVDPMSETVHFSTRSNTVRTPERPICHVTKQIQNIRYRVLVLFSPFLPSRCLMTSSPSLRRPITRSSPSYRTVLVPRSPGGIASAINSRRLAGSPPSSSLSLRLVCCTYGGSSPFGRTEGTPSSSSSSPPFTLRGQFTYPYVYCTVRYDPYEFIRYKYKYSWAAIIITINHHRHHHHHHHHHRFIRSGLTRQEGSISNRPPPDV